MRKTKTKRKRKIKTNSRSKIGVLGRLTPFRLASEMWKKEAVNGGRQKTYDEV